MNPSPPSWPTTVSSLCLVEAFNHQALIPLVIENNNRMFWQLSIFAHAFFPCFTDTSDFLCSMSTELEQPVIVPAACLQEIAWGWEGILVVFTLSYTLPHSLSLSFFALLTETTNPAHASTQCDLCASLCVYVMYRQWNTAAPWKPQDIETSMFNKLRSGLADDYLSLHHFIKHRKSSTFRLSPLKVSISRLSSAFLLRPILERAESLFHMSNIIS